MNEWMKNLNHLIHQSVQIHYADQDYFRQEKYVNNTKILISSTIFSILSALGLPWWVPQGPLTLFPSSPTPDDSIMNVNLQLDQLWSSKIKEKLKIFVRFGYFAPFSLLYRPPKGPSRAPMVCLAVFHVLWLIIFQTRPITSLFSNPFRVCKKNKVNYQII